MATRTSSAPAAIGWLGNELYKRVFLLSGAAVILSAATISFFNTTLGAAQFEQMYSGAALAAITLMPYMISAAVAAITAIGVMAIVPTVGLMVPAESIRERLHALSEGDLASRLAIKSRSPYMQSIISELNLATTTMGHHVARLKLINRQQWELLEAMREITVVSNQAQLVVLIEQMERNWEKIAEIEDTLTT